MNEDCNEDDNGRDVLADDSRVVDHGPVLVRPHIGVSSHFLEERRVDIVVWIVLLDVQKLPPRRARAIWNVFASTASVNFSERFIVSQRVSISLGSHMVH